MHALPTGQHPVPQVVWPVGHPGGGVVEPWQTPLTQVCPLPQHPPPQTRVPLGHDVAQVPLAQT